MSAAPTTTLDERDAEIPDQAKLLDSIFSVAVHHDTKCQRAEDAFYRAMGYRGSGPKHGQTLIDSKVFEDLEGDYRWAMIELCAAIAAASLRRVAAIGMFAEPLVSHGLVTELTGTKLEEFLRPIFDESGIGDRFEVRTGYEVFKRDDD